MGRINRASGNDHIAVQVGQIHGRSDTRKASKDTPTPDTTPGRTENIRAGNARVGRQADAVTGDLHIGF
ncbi:hypothetical protein AB0L86_17850 [Micromonospora musae]|uniref:hypothetical protein n=1 Tax=Micromonospora musae TaxID=1894970 RepID=UPI003441F38B